MKKTLLFLFFAGVMTSACDQIDEIKNFGVDHKFEKSVNLEIGATDPTSFYNSFTFETADDKEFRDNLDKISKYTIKSLTYRIAEFSGDESIMGNGAVVFMSDNNMIGDPIDLGTIAFSKLQSSKDEIEIPISEELKRAVQDNLLNHNKVTVGFEGEVTGAPIRAEFVLAMQIEALVGIE